MDLKSLKEKQAELYERMEEEVRSENYEAFNQLKAEYEQLEQEIRGFEDIETIKQEKEELKMEKQTELRSMLASANPTIMKEEVFSTLIEKMDTDADVLGLAETIANGGESLQFIVEDATAMEAKAVEEGVAVSEIEPILKSVEAKPKRKGAYLEVSKEFLAGFGNASYEQHLQDLLYKAVARKLRNDLINEVKGNAHVEKIETEVAGTIGIDDVANLILSAGDGAYAIVGAPATIRSLKKMKDGDGHYYVQNGVVNGKLTSTFMGVQLLEHAGMDAVDTGKVALALIGQGAVKQVVSSEVEVLPIFGENVKAGKRVFNIDIIHDVVVADEDKVKLLAVK